jgi:hypothetical protein
MASRNSRRLIMQWGLWNPSYLLIRCNTAAYDTSWKKSYHEAGIETCKHSVWKIGEEPQKLVYIFSEDSFIHFFID